jgi:transcriptional regulator with XRE-family HTH domain
MRNWLIQARRERAKTQAEMAADIGIAQSTLACYENDSRRPSVDAAKIIGAYLDVPWTRFFEEDANDA